MKPSASVLLSVLLTGCAADRLTPPKWTATSVSFANGFIAAELATTRAERATGLMNRASLGPGSGMLFVFGADQNPTFSGFYMKGTSIPLSIAFIDAGRRVVGIQDMTPFDTITIHRPAVPYRYALEVNQGWFAANAVTAGASATFVIPTGTVIDP